MQRVMLIYNPASGRNSKLRKAAIEEALAILHVAGVEAEAQVTRSAGSAGLQALDAVRSGCDTILACGGDGTVHEILQSLVGTTVALGILPLGTANALAENLGLVSSPAKAIPMLLDATPTGVPVGKISYHDLQGEQKSRYFTVAAGVGADALFMSRLDPALKHRFGYALYVAAAVRVWVAHSFPLFTAVVMQEDFPARAEGVSQLLAVRIRDFGGLLQTMVPGATLHNHKLRLVAFKTRSRMRFLVFLLAIICKRKAYSQTIELMDADFVECSGRDGSSSHVFVEADGELLGTLPARIEMASQFITLLVPAHARP